MCLAASRFGSARKEAYNGRPTAQRARTCSAELMSMHMEAAAG